MRHSQTSACCPGSRSAHTASASVCPCVLCNLNQHLQPDSIFVFYSRIMWTNQKVSGIMQVVMAQWIDPEPHDWPQYASRLRQLWHKPKWCRSIFVDDAPVPGVTHTLNLHSRLQHIAARACAVCDPQGHRPFPSNTALTKHVTAQHHQHMCTVCLDVSPFCLQEHCCCFRQLSVLWTTALPRSLPVLLRGLAKGF